MEYKLPDEYEKLDYIEIGNRVENPIRTFSITAPVVYREMEEKYIDNFFETGSLLLSTFDRCKRLEDEKRRDTEEGIVNVNGKAGQYKVEMGIGVGRNPFLLCTTLAEPSKCCLKIENIFDFTLCVVNGLKKKGYEVYNIMIGPCFYSSKNFSGIVNEDNIRKILNSKDNKFDFSIIPEIAQEVVRPEWMYFNKSLDFKHENEFRFVFEYKGENIEKDCVIIDVPEAIKYCKKEVYEEL